MRRVPSVPSMLPARWPVLDRVHACTTLRHGAGVSQPPFDSFNLGSRCGDSAACVAKNRAALIEELALSSAPRWLRQVHGVDVVRFDRHVTTAFEVSTAAATSVASAMSANALTSDAPISDALSAENSFDEDSRLKSLLQRSDQAQDAAEPEPEADAAVTSSPGVVLAILTADCLPVVFAAADGSEVAAAHAGWRGLAAGVLEATVSAMHADASNVLAWLGPAAGPEAYEIGEEVFEGFVSRDPSAAKAFVATRPGHWRVDLYALARMRLAAAGLDAQHIHGGGLCTISDSDRFYSHRRSTSDGSGRTGRMATLAWIDENADALRTGARST